MNTDPLAEILQTERKISTAITKATEEAAAALTEARRQAERLVEEARARGQATAERRYEVGLAKARDDADRIRASVDDRVAAMRRNTEPHLSTAVDLVMDTVLPRLEGS